LLDLRCSGSDAPTVTRYRASLRRKCADPDARSLPRERVRCVPGMLNSSEVKVLYPTDGGEGLVMRKGYRREAGSEGSAKQRCEPMDKNRIGGASAGRAGNVSQSPYPSTTRSVDPAAVHRRRLSLPREICRVSPLRRLRRPRGRLTARQKSAEGVVGPAVGKASEALQSRKAEQQIGRAGNDGRRPERAGVASRTGDS